MLMRWAVRARVASQSDYGQCIGRRAIGRAVVVASVCSGMSSRGVPQKVEVEVVEQTGKCAGQYDAAANATGLAEGGGGLVSDQSLLSILDDPTPGRTPDA